MAIGLNGTTSQVNFGNSSALDFGASVTTAVWFYVITADSTGRRLYCKRTDSTSYIESTVADYDGARTVESGRGRATTEQVSGEGGVFSLNTWGLLITVFTSGDFPRMYYGTESVAMAEVGGGSYGYTDVGSGAIGTGAGSDFLVGKRATINSFHGRLARLGMWGHAFSAGEITALRTQTAAEWAAIADCQLAVAFSGTGSQTDIGPNGLTGTATDITNETDPSFPSAGSGHPTIRRWSGIPHMRLGGTTFGNGWSS